MNGLGDSFLLERIRFQGHTSPTVLSFTKILFLKCVCVCVCERVHSGRGREGERIVDLRAVPKKSRRGLIP